MPVAGRYGKSVCETDRSISPDASLPPATSSCRHLPPRRWLGSTVCCRICSCPRRERYLLLAFRKQPKTTICHSLVVQATKQHRAATQMVFTIPPTLIPIAVLRGFNAAQHQQQCNGCVAIDTSHLCPTRCATDHDHTFSRRHHRAS